MLARKHTRADDWIALLAAIACHSWILANQLAGYALLNLLDDPAILALSFC